MKGINTQKMNKKIKRKFFPKKKKGLCTKKQNYIDPLLPK